jgi:hypothetical protein
VDTPRDDDSTGKRAIIASTSRASSRSGLKHIATPTHAERVRGSPPRSYRINSHRSYRRRRILASALQHAQTTVQRHPITFPFLCKHGVGVGIDIGKRKPSFDWIYSFCPQQQAQAWDDLPMGETENHVRKEETAPMSSAFPPCLEKSPSIDQSQLLVSAPFRLSLVECVGLRDAAAGIAETLHRSVVRPAGELLLHRLTEHRAVDVAVCWRLACEFLVEVARVALVEHRRLERGLVLAVEKLAPVYAVEEWVCLFLS